MKVELDKAGDSAINMAEEDAYDAVEEFKKSKELQEYLNSYGAESFDMAYEDLRRYLQAKKPFMDIFFIDMVKNAFFNKRDLDLTPVNDKAAE